MYEDDRGRMFERAHVAWMRACRFFCRCMGASTMAIHQISNAAMHFRGCTASLPEIQREPLRGFDNPVSEGYKGISGECPKHLRGSQPVRQALLEKQFQ